MFLEKIALVMNELRADGDNKLCHQINALVVSPVVVTENNECVDIVPPQDANI
jgi:hypothetical protein